VQAAYAGVRAARGTMKAAADDVQRNISVVTQTRRKQGYLTLMEVCLKLQKAKNLQKSLRYGTFARPRRAGQCTECRLDDEVG
jgi:syndetin